MTDVIELDDGGRVDVASQKLLIRLRGADDWVYTGDLREATELEQNSQVLYRLEEHLVPAGFVEEAPRERENDFRKFRLTGPGRVWVDDHEAELSYPASRAETQEMAYKAVSEAESAKSSVQSYRKKLYRMRKRVEALEELEERVESAETELEYQGGSISGLREFKASSKDVERVCEAHEELSEEVAELREEATNRLNGQEMAIDELQGRMNQLSDENAYLRTQLRELRDKVNRSWKERLRDYFLGKR